MEVNGDGKDDDGSKSWERVGTLPAGGSLVVKGKAEGEGEGDSALRVRLVCSLCSMTVCIFEMTRSCISMVVLNASILCR